MNREEMLEYCCETVNDLCFTSRVEVARLILEHHDAQEKAEGLAFVIRHWSDALMTELYNKIKQLSDEGVGELFNLF